MSLRRKKSEGGEEREEEEEEGPWPNLGAHIIYTFLPALEQENRKFRLQAALC